MLAKSLFTISATLMLSVGMSTAYAQCSELENGLIICDGDTNEALTDGRNDLNVMINEGASISGTDVGVALTGDGIIYQNKGTVTASNGPAFIGAGDGGRVTNFCTSTTQSLSDDAMVLSGGTIFDNHGQVLSGMNSGDGVEIPDGVVLNQFMGRIISMGTSGDPDNPNAGIRVTKSDKMLTITNTEYIEGEVGILVDIDNTGRQTLYNKGTIIGTSGVALSFGKGVDTLFQEGQGIIQGTADLGEDIDTLFVRDKQGFIVGGPGALFDGGEGGEDYDTIVFDDSVLKMDIGPLVLINSLTETYELAFRNSDNSNSLIRFRNFEFFKFGDGTVTLSELMEIAPIPLPTAAPLFASALGFGAWLRRRQRKNKALKAS